MNIKLSGRYKDLSLLLCILVINLCIYVLYICKYILIFAEGLLSIKIYIKWPINFGKLIFLAKLTLVANVNTYNPKRRHWKILKLLNLRSFRGINRVNFKFDILNNDIPADGLHKDVSDGLQIPYLSKYKESQEELSQNLQYKGAIIGDHSRLFFSIPTARGNS